MERALHSESALLSWTGPTGSVRPESPQPVFDYWSDHGVQDAGVWPEAESVGDAESNRASCASTPHSILNDERSTEAFRAMLKRFSLANVPRLTKVAVENFRCFASPQEARLAPLTLLVGENSTGKTSFLALIRAIWNTVVLGKVPDFTEAPYHLGTFDDIVSNSGNGNESRNTFRVGLSFETNPRNIPLRNRANIQSSSMYADRGGIPFPISREFISESASIKVMDADKSHLVKCKTPSHEWDFEPEYPSFFEGRLELLPIGSLGYDFERSNFGLGEGVTSGAPSTVELEALKRLLQSLSEMQYDAGEAYASAPVRSRPQRTYDLGRPATDPEGENSPTYLARMQLQDGSAWIEMKQKLESCGGKLGLFDQIQVHSLGRRSGGPFQIEIKKRGYNNEHVGRNLIDVGYGVSQILPLLTEILRDDGSQLCLLQQPEVHLHPSAQAGLGTLFAELCSSDRQFIIETHSDYLINRVRMDVRDRECELRENDVSILYFESVGENVVIHSIRIDSMGNILNAPESYRSFFTNEIDRELQF